MPSAKRPSTKAPTRSDSATAAIAAAEAAATPYPDWPAHVKQRACDKPFWHGVVRARTRAEWTDADLVVGAQLARVQADIERETNLMEAEGTVVLNFRETQIMNPRVTVIERMSARELALMRILRMGGAATGDPRTVKPARALERAAGLARETLRAEDPEGLLAS